MPINKELLAMLVCPKCKGELRYANEKLDCNKCRLRYGVIDGHIPNMLIDEAEKF